VVLFCSRNDKPFVQFRIASAVIRFAPRLNQKSVRGVIPHLEGNLEGRTLLITRQTCVSSHVHFNIINAFLVANYSVYSHKPCELFIWSLYRHSSPIPVAARSKIWVCGSSLTGIPGSNPPGSVEVCILWVMCLSGRGLCDELITNTQSPAECGVSDCDREASTVR